MECYPHRHLFVSFEPFLSQLALTQDSRILEVDVGLCCGCLFVFPVFVKHHKHYFIRLLPSRTGGGSSMTYGVTETKSESRSTSWPQRNPSNEMISNSANFTSGTSRTSTRDMHDDEAIRYNSTRPLEPE